MSMYFSQKQRELALKLLSDAIAIETVNPVGNERALADFIASYLRDTGCSVEVVEFEKGRSNVIAKLKGREKGNTLMINGHLDTVPFGNLQGWESPPNRATIKDGMLYGRGASDMKGGLCAALYAFRQICLEGIEPNNDIIFLGTGDEESMGQGAKEALKSGIFDDVSRIVIGEPTNNEISVASKGTLWLEFTVNGKTSHGAYPWEGVNAAEIAYELFDKVNKLLISPTHKYLSSSTCTLTKIQGGVKANMVPDICTITIDIRTIPSINHHKLLEMIDGIIVDIERLHSGSSVQYSILNNRMAVEIEADHPLIENLTQSIQYVRNAEPKLVGTGFFSDASIFLRDHYIPTVLFGPGESSEAHKPNERLSLNKYFESVEIYYEFLKKQ